jgi:hypothetical protein
MATHQHIGMNLKAKTGWENAQQVEKLRVLTLILKDLPFFQAAV